MAAGQNKGGASALPTFTVTETGEGSTFRTLRYADPQLPASAFDGTSFMESWTLLVGSVHRHHATGELVLCWSTEGPHPMEREALRARLEGKPNRVASVLAAVDYRDHAVDSRFERRAA